MRYFYIDPPGGQKARVSLDGSQVRHIKNVLRLKSGDHIGLYDGTGFEYEAVIQSVSAQRVDVEILRRFKAPATSPVKIFVAQAFLKEKKMDELLRRLCELGIAGWVPFFSRRSIARPEKKRLAARCSRWQRIAIEALKQCRRNDLPQIAEPMGFDDVLEYARDCDLKIVFWEEAATTLDAQVSTEAPDPPEKLILMLGPEGGFSTTEIKQARDGGFTVASLGPRILRAETATIAACSLIQYLYGDMGKKILTKPRSWNNKRLF